jgi:hypothetical protein
VAEGVANVSFGERVIEAAGKPQYFPAGMTQ